MAHRLALARRSEEDVEKIIECHTKLRVVYERECEAHTKQPSIKANGKTFVNIARICCYAFAPYFQFQTVNKIFIGE